MKPKLRSSLAKALTENKGAWISRRRLVKLTKLKPHSQDFLLRLLIYKGVVGKRYVSYFVRGERQKQRTEYRLPEKSTISPHKLCELMLPRNQIVIHD